MAYKYLFKFQEEEEQKVTQKPAEQQNWLDKVGGILGNRDAQPPKLVNIAHDWRTSTIQGIDVIHDFEWTHTPTGGRHEVPWVRMSEYKVKYNSLIQNIKYQLNAAGGTMDHLIKALAGSTKPVNKTISALPDGQGDQFKKSLGSEATRKSWIGDMTEEVTDLQAPNSLPSYLHPYFGLYGTKPSGFEYYFPYFETDWKSTNADWGSIDSSAGGIAAPILSIFGEQGTAATAANTSLLNQNVLGAYIERPKMFSYGQEGETIKFTVTLLNTSNQEDIIRNWHLAFMLAYQNLPSRTSKIFLEPPVIYEVEVPGLFYSPFAYLQSLRIINRGATRVMKIPYLKTVPQHEQQVDNARNFGDNEQVFFRDLIAAKRASRQSKFSSQINVADAEKDIVHYIDTIIPDAYQINIELKSLIPDSKNLFYHSALGSGTLGRGIYSTAILKNPS